MSRAIIALLLLAVVVLPIPANASEQVPDGNGGMVDVFPMVFPVDGPNRYTDTWGAPRSGGRTHIGTDIMAADGIPVLAAADGVVSHINWASRADLIDPSRCCTIGIRHEGGWVTNYLHLNHDPALGVETVAGWGIVDGLLPGVKVKAGQLIGWVGHSGNASPLYPHLHFELIKDGVPINPYPHVVRAVTGPVGRFFDTFVTVHRTDIDRIAELGITKGCNPPTNTLFCPERELTRGEVAAMLRRALELPASPVDAFTDDGASIFEGDINALAAVGIAFGCTATEFCPDRPLLREEMARFLVRSYGYPASGVDAFVDDDGSPFEPDIDALAAVGVTKGCNPPTNDRFCPERTLTRAEFASFMVRAIDRAG